jgi:hypothetical protein
LLLLLHGRLRQHLAIVELALCQFVFRRLRPEARPPSVQLIQV